MTKVAVPANLQFAGGPAQVDLSADRQLRSWVVAAVPSCYDDTWVRVAMLPSDYDTDKDFAFIVTNEPSIQDALHEGDELKLRQAIDSEVASLQHNQVFRQVDANQSGKVITTKIIMVERQNDRGEFEHHKLRLVAQGFFQRPRFDFDNEATYAPTVDLTILRLLLA